MDNKIISGEELAWQRLADSNIQAICSNSLASYDATDGCYIISSFGEYIGISPKHRQIKGCSKKADYLLAKLSYFYKLSLLWYLIESKNIALTGRLVNPLNIRGGDIFFKGSHVLPLEKISNSFSDRDSFLKKAISLGGRLIDSGDVAIELFPFPRIPIRLILWFADDEFPASTELLLDSSCEIQLPLDVIWSTTIFTINAMLIDDRKLILD
ncbi:MAG TPA: DUF3786 domain-containing protein [Nitrospirae bacterium]|nr:DUF3786 domain-containing protein [Nitrospirota bacterium]